MRKDFYIFRHGESTYNQTGRTQGRTNDSVLTELGKRQALDVGKRLKNKGIEIIISSPLVRAKQTADLANKELNVPVNVDEHFIEVNVGEAEGLNYKDIQTKFGDIFAKMHDKMNKTEDVCYPGGETRRQVKERIFEGLNNLAKNDKHNVFAIASHGIMLSQTINALNGNCNDDIKNGSILHIKNENDEWSIVEWI